MARKSTGYYFDEKAEKYAIDKIIGNQRIRYTTRFGKGEAIEVERELANHIDRYHRAKMYGERIPRTFREAGVRYVLLNQDQKRISDVEGLLRRLDGFVGDVFIHELHKDHPALQAVIQQKKAEGCKTKTTNSYLEIVRRVLTAATDWRDEVSGLTWLERAPTIKLLKVKDAREPRPLMWQEQDRLISLLPPHQQALALFYINTGLRKTEALRLSWEWEIMLPDGLSGFLLPAEVTKSGVERFVPLNSVAKAVVDAQRGIHPERVFTYQGAPLATANNSAFQRARNELGIPLRLHDYRHTFGHRLRVAGVDEETRARLLGHARGSMTAHYSMDTLDMLFEAVEKITVPQKEKPTIIMLNDYRRRNVKDSCESPDSPQGEKSSFR